MRQAHPRVDGFAAFERHRECSCRVENAARLGRQHRSTGNLRELGDERAELVALRRKTRVLELEVEILKRASAYFARENVLPK